MLHTQRTINCGGRLLDLNQPRIMGVLNVTPDSFYDGGRFSSPDQALAQVENMIRDGADIIDVGGMSSRPGAELISSDEELKRIEPVIAGILKRFPDLLLSVDTIYGRTVEVLAPMGIGLVNDISAGRADEGIIDAVIQHKLPYVLMHMQGKPRDMQRQPHYENVVQEVLDFFIDRVGDLRRRGVGDIILDPGFGFGKSLDHNYALLKSMHVFKLLDLPIMAGISRKSMIYKLLDTDPEGALTGTIALHMVALQQGAKILRVHDVSQAGEVIKLWQQLENL
jgi:dihydropteroate synthase